MGDKVLMYREQPVGKWLGPYLVQNKDNKMMTLDTGDRLIRASIDKVKPYLDARGELFLDSHLNRVSIRIDTADTVAGCGDIEDYSIIPEVREEDTTNSPNEEVN